MRADVSVSRGEYMHMHVMYTSISGIGVKKHHSDQKKSGQIGKEGRKEGRQARRQAGRKEGRKEGRKGRKQ